jgi:ectoine hydroxylase-related dioxygenase (phytanoyl-CoA dioxygenase family)
MRHDEARLREIHEQGFTLVPDVLPPAEIPVLKSCLVACIEEDLRTWGKPGYPDGWMVQNLMVRGLPFARLLENELLHSYFAALLGDTCIIYAFTSSSMPPRGTNFSHRIHVDSPRFIPGYVTNVGVMIALDDFTPENGATYFLPGSHVRPEKPSEAEFFAGAVRVFPRAGEAVIFNCRTYHMGGENQTEVPRHALTMNICRSFMRQRFDYPRMVQPEVLDCLGELGKRFLGFHVRMPTCLEEYYLPENERLYKPNQG